MTIHPLDNPAWTSLVSDHRDLATGEGPVRRYLPEIGPFAGVEDVNEQSLGALLDCIRETGPVLFARTRCSLSDFAVPQGLRAVWDRPVVQMVFEEGATTGELDERIVALGAEDVPEMLQLTQVTKPGPFETRTHEMGQYWGIRQGGKLVAMAGERMRQPGFTEVSAICTHPDHQGAGFGRALTLHTARAILERGAVPYLHAFDDNARAIGLYELLGFRHREDIRAIALQAA